MCVPERLERTNASVPGVVDCPSSVAQLALRSSIQGTLSARLCHAISACARMPYNRFHRIHHLMMVRGITHKNTRTNARAFIVVDCPTSVARFALSSIIGGAFRAAAR